MKIRFKLNGEEREAFVEPQDRLLDLLREKLEMQSPKEGCGTGDCGLCTVIVDDRPIISCISLAFQVRNRDIVTLEGLNKTGGLIRLQEKFRDSGAAQCGYCTPAMEIMAFDLLEATTKGGLPNPSEAEIRAQLSGTLCRCTGYYQIIEATSETIREEIEVERRG